MNTLSKVLTDPIFDYKCLIVLAPIPEGFGVFMLHYPGIDSWELHTELIVIAKCKTFKEALQAYTITKIVM